MPLQVIGTSYDTSGMVLARYANDGSGPTLAFVKSRNATKGAQTIVQANDNLGMIRFLGSDGTDTQNAAARIRAFCDGTPASNKIPGRITFETTDTLTYARERMRIDSSGRVVIGGPGSNGGGSNTYIGGGALAVLGTPYTPNTYACFAMGRVGANVTANTTITNIRLNGGTLGTGRGAEINAAADANWSDASSHPTRLTFHTVASGSTSSTERLRITSTGAINCGHGSAVNLHGSTTTGINLNANNNSGQIIANASGNRALIIGRQASYGQVIEFFQGTNTNEAGISIPAADTLGLETNGTERARIDSNGRFLIGRTGANLNATVQIGGRYVDASSTTVDLDTTGTEGPNLKLHTSSNTANHVAALVFDHGSLKSMIAGGRVNTSNWGTDIRFYTHPESTSNVHETYERMKINSSGHLVPAATNTYDLGASGLRWRNLYINDLQLSNKGKTNDVDGTWGDWTLQEGEHKIYMINNRTGKKYSLKMEQEYAD